MYSLQITMSGKLWTSEKAYIVSDGTIIAEGTTDIILSDERVRQVYLGDDFRM